MAQKKSASEKDAAGGHAFTCKECGSHEILVEHFFTAYAGPHWTDFREEGALVLDPGRDSAHTVEEWSEPEEVESGTDADEDDFEDEGVGGGTSGNGEKDKSGEDEREDGDEEKDADEDEDEEEDEDGEELAVDDDSHTYFVRCKGCNREIEFGLTQPGGEDKIWPAECSDFDPAKCWPDPRYQDAWVRRGWIPKG